MKLLIFIGLNVGGALGWWLAESQGVMLAFIASGIGSMIGVWAGWRAAREWL